MRKPVGQHWQEWGAVLLPRERLFLQLNLDQFKGTAEVLRIVIDCCDDIEERQFVPDGS